MLTTIPFSGFYESEHDAEIDHAFNSLMYDLNAMVAKVWDKVDWHGVQVAYAKFYTEAFLDHFKIKGTFESMQSPKEYNFVTDRIIVEIEADEVKRILKACGVGSLVRKAREKFTSRSGFISYYSPDPMEWGEIDTWDHNQVGCLIEAYVENIAGNDWQEMDLMEYARDNGKLDNWIFENCEDMNRWATLAEYIYDRANR